MPNNYPIDLLSFYKKTLKYSLDKQDSIQAIQTTFRFRDTNYSPIFILGELIEIKSSYIQETL